MPTLWLATGFEYGASIVVYAPPNPIELREFSVIKGGFEERLHRSITIRIMHNGEDVLSLFEQNPEEYTRHCKESHSSRRPFTDDFHIQELKRHFQSITRDATRSLVFPFETKVIHREELASYANIVLPDIPTIDKAQHNFLLRQHKFTELPHLLVSSSLIHFERISLR